MGIQFSFCVYMPVVLESQIVKSAIDGRLYNIDFFYIGIQTFSRLRDRQDFEGGHM